MPIKIQTAGRTDTGKRRDNNQDQFFIAELNKSLLVEANGLNIDPQSRLIGVPFGKMLVVADGMGGHQAGSEASWTAIDLLVSQALYGMRWPARGNLEDEEAFLASIKNVFEKAHRLILKESEKIPEKRGMGTTLTVCLVSWPVLYIAHVGDCRCYLLRLGEMQQLTKDHTLSGQLARQSKMTEEEAENSKWSHVLYNALGAGGIDVAVETNRVLLQPDDQILICTDGLYRHVKSNEIGETLMKTPNLDEACANLIELANSRGGQDNITVVTAHCIDDPSDDVSGTVVATNMTLNKPAGGLGSHHDILEETKPLSRTSVAETLDFPRR